GPRRRRGHRRGLRQDRLLAGGWRHHAAGRPAGRWRRFQRLGHRAARRQRRRRRQRRAGADAQLRRLHPDHRRLPHHRLRHLPVHQGDELAQAQAGGRRGAAAGPERGSEAAHRDPRRAQVALTAPLANRAGLRAGAFIPGQEGMRVYSCLLAGFLAFSTLSSPAVRAADAGLDAQAIATAERLREQALAGNLAWDFVEGLTTEIGPRLAGTEADARAVAWTKARFEQMGFDRVWLEPVTFPVWLRQHERAEVVSPFPQPLVITALGGSIGTEGALEAEVVEFATLDALKAAPEGSLEGKIAFISNRMERFRDGRGYGPAVGARSQGAVEAARKGAVAVVIRSIGTSNDRFAHIGVMRYADDVPRIPAAALSNPDADQLARMLAAGHAVKLRLDIGA